MKDLLYRILPTSLYKKLSKSYFFLLESFHNTDPDLIKAIRHGFILTILIITTFSFFPGEPMDFSSLDEERKRGEGDDNSFSNLDEVSANTFSTRVKYRLVVWIMILIGGIIILQTSYDIDLGYILSIYFPKETLIFQRILGQGGIYDMVGNG
jgi:hypothetical protein